MGRVGVQVVDVELESQYRRADCWVGSQVLVRSKVRGGECKGGGEDDGSGDLHYGERWLKLKLVWALAVRGDSCRLMMKDRLRIVSLDDVIRQ